MVANATIDLNKILSSADSSTKSFADNKSDSNAFENVFNSVNKNFKNDETNNSTKIETNTSDRTNPKADSTQTSKENSSTEKNDTNKVKNNRDNDNNYKNKPENSTDEASDQEIKVNNDKSVKNADDRQEEQDNQTALSQTETVSTEVIVQNTAVNTSNINNENIITEKANANIGEAQSILPKATVDEAPTETTDAAEKTQVEASAKAKSATAENTALSSQPTALTNEFAETLKTKVNATDAEVAKVANNMAQSGASRAEAVGAATKNQNNIPDSVQPQAKTLIETPSPALSQVQSQNTEIQAQSVKNEAIAAQSRAQAQSINAETNINTTQAQQVNQAVVNQVDFGEASSTPVIQATTEALASNVSTDKSNPKTEDILNKASITQEVINKTDAKITNVENSFGNSSNSNDLLKKQSPQEQVMRLSLEQSSKPTEAKTSEINMANVRDTGSLNFAKTIDNVQTQAPKEISKTDVLSQINNQLTPLKEEGATKVTIVLKPENLGKISIELTNGKDGLVARMTTDNAQVKELLDKSLDSLKDTLGNQGVSVNNVSVKVNEVQKQDTMFSFDGQKDQGSQQKQPENQNANKNQQAFLGQESFEDDSEILTETPETNTRVETSVSMNSKLGKVDYKI